LWKRRTDAVGDDGKLGIRSQMHRNSQRRSTVNIGEIRSRVIRCENCELHKTRTNSVPGKGSLGADIVFVGEAPGRSEDMRGEPFVGAAGRRLSAALEKAGISREEVYITNVVKCRPPGNRVPLQDERIACGDYIKGEIGTIKPKIICVMGNTAFRSLLGGSGITRYRGTVFSKNGDLYFVSLHPAATIYNQKLVQTLERDIRELVRISQKIKNGGAVRVDYEVAS